MKKQFCRYLSALLSLALLLAYVPILEPVSAEGKNHTVEVFTEHFSECVDAMYNDLPSYGYCAVGLIDVDFDGELELVVSGYYGGSGLFTRLV